MAEQMIEQIKQMMQQAVGISDEDFQTWISAPVTSKMAGKSAELMKYKIVAEVIEAKYCFAGLKPGQKYVFSAMPAMLLPEESDCPLCIRALGPLANLMMGFWDRIMEGVDPNQGMWQMAECLDPGIGRGGLGHVVFRVYAQEIASG